MRLLLILGVAMLAAAVVTNALAANPYPYQITIQGLATSDPGRGSGYSVTNLIANDAEVLHGLYTSSGTLVRSFTRDLPANGTRSYDLRTMDSVYLGPGSYVVIRSTQPITGSLFSAVYFPLLKN